MYAQDRLVRVYNLGILEAKMEIPVYLGHFVAGIDRTFERERAAGTASAPWSAPNSKMGIAVLEMLSQPVAILQNLYLWPAATG
jgi:hypothetical protein